MVGQTYFFIRLLMTFFHKQYDQALLIILLLPPQISNNFLITAKILKNHTVAYRTATSSWKFLLFFDQLPVQLWLAIKTEKVSKTSVPRGKSFKPTRNTLCLVWTSSTEVTDGLCSVHQVARIYCVSRPQGCSKNSPNCNIFSKKKAKNETALFPKWYLVSNYKSPKKTDHE